MAALAGRKARGMATQAGLASYLREQIFPWATDAGPGRAGQDILNTPGLNIECKARADFSPLAWLKQAESWHSDQGPPLAIAVWRPNGYGFATIERWPAMLRLGPLVATLRAAGYGEAP